jgi:hypothetical protein
VSQSLARLDAVLRSHEQRQDLGPTLSLIAAEGLWPGLRRPAGIPAYLQSISGGAADLVVASLLILLDQDDSALDDVAWRPQAGDLLAKNLERLQPHVQKPQERGAHAVFTACVGTVSAIEDDLRAEIRKFAHARKAKVLQNGVLRRLNSSAGLLVLRPFVPPGDSDRDLQALLTAIVNFDTDDADAADARFAALPLLDQQRPFLSDSRVFSSSDEQHVAKEVAETYGKRLAPTMPLGYQNQAILVALPDNCPNNVPPIFWSDAGGWVPLFARTPR